MKYFKRSFERSWIPASDDVAHKVLDELTKNYDYMDGRAVFGNDFANIQYISRVPSSKFSDKEGSCHYRKIKISLTPHFHLEFRKKTTIDTFLKRFRQSKKVDILLTLYYSSMELYPGKNGTLSVRKFGARYSNPIFKVRFPDKKSMDSYKLKESSDSEWEEVSNNKKYRETPLFKMLNKE
jgi:hypothetical protein